MMLYYLLTNSMYEVESYTINDPNIPTKLLIATQGSEFKDRVTQNIIAHYKPDKAFIQVLDISNLHKINPEEYNAIIIMHTWEYGDAPDNVTQFLKRNNRSKYKIVMLATSGDGSKKIKGVDAITGESSLETASSIAAEIIEQVQQILPIE